MVTLTAKDVIDFYFMTPEQRRQNILETLQGEQRHRFKLFLNLYPQATDLEMISFLIKELKEENLPDGNSHSNRV